MSIHVHGLVKGVNELGQASKTVATVKAKAEKGCFAALIEKVQNLFRSFLALIGKKPKVDLGKLAAETVKKLDQNVTSMDEQYLKLKADNAKIMETLAKALERFS